MTESRAAASAWRRAKPSATSSNGNPGVTSWSALIRARSVVPCPEAGEAYAVRVAEQPDAHAPLGPRV